MIEPKRANLNAYKAIGNVLISFFLVLITGGFAFSQSEMELLTFEQQFVESAVKAKQRLEEAPSAVYIISSDIISKFSFISLGDMLNWTPGIWGVYNYATYNFGVRGIHGGPKAGSRIFKVMIDSSDYVVFRPSGESLIGPEFIPISMIKSVEVVKGPSSALYGANAFMGVINVRTKEADEMESLFLKVFPGLTFGEKKINLFQVGEVSGSIVSNIGALEIPFAVGLYFTRWKRDGLRFSPDSIGFSTDPAVTNVKEVKSNTAKYLDRFSENDDLSTLSLFGKTGLRYGDLEVKLRSFFQGFSASAQFLDYGMLNPRNRVSLLNTGVALESSYSMNIEGFIIRPSVYAGIFHSSPLTEPFVSDKIKIFAPDKKSLETGDYVGVFGSTARDGRVEISAQKGRNLILIGFDIMRDFEDIMVVYQEFPFGLTEVSRPEEAKVEFRNIGLYGQSYIFPVDEVTRWRGFSVLGIGGLAGIRFDDHNIYEDVFNMRFGVVILPLKKIDFLTYLKGIYGSSFRAPSAEQLFAAPQIAGDFKGNVKLKPEKSRTFEAILGGDFRLFGVSVKPELSLYFISVKDAIKFEREGAFIKALNIENQRSTGIDIGLGVRTRYLETSVNYSFSSLKIFDEEFGEDVEYRDEFFPPHILNFSLMFRRENVGAVSSLSLGVLGRFVGRRSIPTVASKMYTGFSYPEEKHYLPSYFNLGLTARVETQELFGYTTAGVIRLESIPSLFGKRYWEPGFSGLDIPGTMPMIFFGIEQSL